MTRTLHGPNIEHVCVDCGGVCYAIPEWRDPRCEGCSQRRHGVPRPVERLALVAPLGTKTIARGRGTVIDHEARRAHETVGAPAPLGTILEPTRAALASELPRGAAQLVAVVVGISSPEASWSWRASISRGWFEGARAMREVTAVVVHLRHRNPDVYAIAVWWNGKSECCLLRDASGVRKLGVTELRGLIKAGL